MYYYDNEMCLILNFYISNLIVCVLDSVLVKSKTLNSSSNPILIGLNKLKQIQSNPQKYNIVRLDSTNMWIESNPLILLDFLLVKIY